MDLTNDILLILCKDLCRPETYNRIQNMISQYKCKKIKKIPKPKNEESNISPNGNNLLIVKYQNFYGL